jgi:NADPH:quinone reductase-like Zn-dependent oxidoreductase
MKSDKYMRGVTVPRYGGPDVLQVVDVPRSQPGPGEVLVRVAWGAVNAADWRLMRADPWMVRLAFGLRRPRFAALGIAMSGTVVESNADGFSPGDGVAGDLSASGCGAFAEYVCVGAPVLARVPDGVELDIAATLPLAGTTALQAIRDQGHLRDGQNLMVIGASVAVGSAAVELGRNMGANVWAVTGTAGRPLVERLGGTHVVDRQVTDVTTDAAVPPGSFDLIIDTGSYRSIFDYKPLLAPEGIYVHVGGSMKRLAQTAICGGLRSRGGGPRWKTFTATADAGDLEKLLAMADANRISPPIGARIPLSDAAEALGMAEEHRVPGRVLIDME